MKPGAAPRAAAAQTLAAVMNGEALDRAIQKYLPDVAERDKALCQELCYGTLRFYPRFDAMLEHMLDRPMRKKDQSVYALAMLGFYQLSEMRIPPHAAVSATVDATSLLKKKPLAGLLNALLRRFQRERAALEQALPEAAAQCHPRWLYDLLGQHWPEQRTQIITANNARPPMTLRVNLSRIDRSSYLQELTKTGISAREGRLNASAITLEEAMDVSLIPGFHEGLCSVQDEAAQLAAPLLALQEGETVLDACAAPGGKSAHLFETQPLLGALTALDIKAERLLRVEENHARLAVPGQILCGDGANPSKELREQGPFDAILLDAPCSASGVIRRHPDIKLLRRPEDIEGFAAQQRALLTGLWPLLKPGGRLLYVSCSVLPQENSAMMKWFLEQTDEAEEESLRVEQAEECTHGLQLLPDAHAWDGLYFCLLHKNG